MVDGPFDPIGFFIREGEFDGLVVHELSEVPEDQDGQVLHVIDDGEIYVLYECEQSGLREIDRCY